MELSQHELEMVRLYRLTNNNTKSAVECLLSVKNQNKSQQTDNMKYYNTNNIYKSAMQVLVDYNITTLPIKVTDIIKQTNIKLLNNSDCNFLKSNQLGICIFIDNEWYIIVNDTMKIERIRFTIAHELGHIFLGHRLQYSDKEDKNGKPITEITADIFATLLLAPPCLIQGLGLKEIDDISRVFNIEFDANCFDDIRPYIIDYNKNNFLETEFEKKVYSNFKNYIETFNYNNKAK